MDKTFYTSDLLINVRKMEVVILTALSLILNFSLKCCATNPSGVVPRTTTAMEGSNVTLYCTIVKNSSEAVSWTSSHSLILLSRGNKILKEGLVSTSQYDRLSISGNSDLGEYNLNFENVQAEDAGQYSCGYFSVSQREAIFSPRASLTVILPPLCEYFPQNLDLTPGIQIQMVCTSQNNRPNTDLTWLRNGQSLRGTPSSQTERSNTINYMLTEDDYDQPFTCIESMSPLSYVPICFITPLRQTSKPVHIVSSPEVVTAGGISHFTCLTNQSLETFSYRWFVDSNLTPSVTNMYSFGPVGSDDNGTSVTCEVHRDGALYGRDEIVVIVTPEPEATYRPISGPTIVNVTTSKPLRTSTYPSLVRAQTRVISDDETLTINLIQEPAVNTPEKFTPNPMEGYVMIFIVFASLIGVLLIITIFCLAMVLARHKPNKYSGSQEKIDTSSTLEMREPSDADENRTFAESNIINEHIEAQKSPPPHYHTLEPNSKSSDRKERRTSDCSVPYSVVSKNKKGSKKGEGQLDNGCQGGDLAYAVTPVPMTNGRRHMSAKRPLPERPDKTPEYKIPCRSKSESKVDYKQKKGKYDQCPPLEEAGNLEEMPIAQNSSGEVVKRRKDQSNLVIETEYTEVRDGSNNMQDTLLKGEEKAYEFTTVYDALEDEKNNVLPSNPDSGYHDNSSTESTEVDMVHNEGQRSEITSSSLSSNDIVKKEADDNLYASLEDCSV